MELYGSLGLPLSGYVSADDILGLKLQFAFRDYDRRYGIALAGYASAGLEGGSGMYNAELHGMFVALRWLDIGAFAEFGHCKNWHGEYTFAGGGPIVTTRLWPLTFFAQAGLRRNTETGDSFETANGGGAFMRIGVGFYFGAPPPLAAIPKTGGVGCRMAL